MHYVKRGTYSTSSTVSLTRDGESASRVTVAGFGSITVVTQSLVSDIRYGTRLLRQSPVFCAIAVLALALGIGANTGIYSTVHALLLRALPYGDPDRLVMIWEDATFAGFPKNTPAPGNYYDWKANNRVSQT